PVREAAGRRLAFGGLNPRLADPGQHPFPELVRSVLATARARQHRLDLALEVVLPQAWRALVEVLLDDGVRGDLLAHLAVEEEVDPVEDLSTLGVVRLAAAHLPTSFATAGRTPRS